jgi:hypothetical protein
MKINLIIQTGIFMAEDGFDIRFLTNEQLDAYCVKLSTESATSSALRRYMTENQIHIQPNTAAFSHF